MSKAEIDAKVAATAASQYGLITRRQAREAGLSPRAIRHRLLTGQWEAVFWTVFRLAGVPKSWRQDLLAAVLAAGGKAVAGGFSAAALWRVPGFMPGPIELRTPYGVSRDLLQRGPAQSCLLLPHHTTVVERIPVTTATRTIFDLAAIVSAERAERALDNALAMRLTDVARLEALLQELGKRGRTGTTVMRQLLADRGEGYVATESELEHRFVKFTLAFGLPMPRRQVTLIAGRVDFLFDPGRVVAEVDGRRNHTALLDREADAVRDAKLAAQGLRVIRITYRRLMREPEAVAADLRAAINWAA
jgi:very-short-patch-repair endonuclease